MKTRERVVIANCGGFWGDDPDAARRQVLGGPIDYLVMDYLAEVTMAILQKQRQRRPRAAGFAGHFLPQLRDVLADCVERGITIVSNAGGVNPGACAAEVERLAAELGLADRVRVGVVTGDDVYDRLDELPSIRHMETGESLDSVRDAVVSANAYVGAAPVVRALEGGANVVVCGRVADASLVLAPLRHEFGWAADDWDRIAAGIVAGHVIECGTQVTGGNFTDWREVPSFRDMGFPIVEVRPDGSFTVTKHPGTGGLVSVHTVTEQLVYEIGPPRYLTPDCVVRFDTAQLEQEGPDRVRVTGVRGEPAPDKLKVSVIVHAGYRSFGRLMIAGPDTLEKARTVAEAFWEAAGGRELYEDTRTQFVGWDSCRPTEESGEPPEILLQFAVRDRDADKIRDRFAAQIVSRVLSTVPGITYLADQGSPRIREAFGHWPALLGREHLRLEVEVGGRREEVEERPGAGPAAEIEPPRPELPPVPSGGRRRRVPLSRLCLARSGDKGDICNIGVIARSPAIYAWMLDALTTDLVSERFGEIVHGDVRRYELPNLLAVNFLLERSLGGGGTLSLLLDAQGKTYAQHLLSTHVVVDDHLIA